VFRHDRALFEAQWNSVWSTMEQCLELGGAIFGASGSPSRVPWFKLCAWANSFTLLCSSLPSCMNYYMVINSGGYL